MCIPGHECNSHFVRSARNAGKGTRSPVPGTILLSLSGHPLTLSCSLEIANAPGPADVSRLGLRISAGADILDKNLADKFCQSIQNDTLVASKRCCRTSDGWPGRFAFASLHHVFGVYKHKIPGLFAITIALVLAIDHGLIAVGSGEMNRDIIKRGRRR